MSSLTIRQYGDPVLKERTREVEDIDGAVASLVESMIETMYDAPGTGLAANQVGVQRRLFVYDVGRGRPRRHQPPDRRERRGVDLRRGLPVGARASAGTSCGPTRCTWSGLDLDGNEISIEASELEGRVFQHELDHLDGILLVERLDEDQRKEALKILRGRTLDLPASDPDGLASLFTAESVRAGRAGPRGPCRLPYGERVARLAFLGTPEMAVPPLRALVDGRARRRAVRDPARPPPRPRRERATPSPVKAAATELGLPVTHDMDDVAAAGVELAVVVAYGRIIPARLLEQVPMVNLHFSLLPRWRGAAPVERAILAGDRRDGRLPHEGRGGARHRPGLRRAHGAARTTTSPRRAARRAGRRSASALLVDALADGVAGLARARAPGGRGHHRRRRSRPEDLHLDWSEPAAPAAPGGAPRPGLDDVPGQAADACSRPRRCRAGRRRRAARRAPSTAPVGRDGRRQPACCDGCSPRAVLPCQPRTGCAACALRSASVSGRTRHERGDRDSDRRVEP